jgi:hypothetical protein
MLARRIRYFHAPSCLARHYARTSRVRRSEQMMPSLPAARNCSS